MTPVVPFIQSLIPPELSPQRLRPLEQKEFINGNWKSENEFRSECPTPIVLLARILSVQLFVQVQQLNPASVVGRLPATPAQPKPSNELVTRASRTATNSSQPTIDMSGFSDSMPRSATTGSAGEPVHLHVAPADTLAAAKEDLKSNRLESAYEKAQHANQTDTVWSLFDETPEQVLSTIRRAQQQSPRPIETLVLSADSDQSKAPASPRSDSTDFSATRGQVAASAAVPDQILKRLDQPQSAPADQTTNISNDELAKQLLAESRQLMRGGRFDDARAAAIRAKNLNATFDMFSDEPQAVLCDIGHISRTMSLTKSSQAKLDTLPPFKAAPDKVLMEDYEVLQLTSENDDSQSVELVTNRSSSVTEVTPIESSVPCLIQPAANAHETRRSLLPLPSARRVGVWVKNDAPLEMPTVASN